MFDELSLQLTLIMLYLWLVSVGTAATLNTIAEHVFGG
jgi:hypothetical protein